MKKTLFVLISVAMMGYSSCNKENLESSLPFGLPGTQIFDMAIDNNNMLYFVTSEIDKSEPYSLLSSYIPHKFYLSRKSEKTGKVEILDNRYQPFGKLCFDKNNHLLTHDNKAIYRIEGSIRHKLFELPDESHSHTYLSFIVVDDNNNIWAGGSQAGLYKIDDTRLNVTHYHVDNSELPTNNLKNIYIDKNNDIWILTEGRDEKQGILRVSNNKWVVYNNPDSYITSLVTDKNGYLWIGTGWDNENQNLFRFDGTEWETVIPRNDKNEMVKGFVARLQSDGRKLYVVITQVKNMIDYFSYSHVLLTFDGENWDKIHVFPENDFMGDLIVDNYRQVVWFWTLNKGKIFKIPI